MRIISVIRVEKETSTILSIDSFGVFEEQLVSEVVDKAEETFIKECFKLGVDEDDLNDYVEDAFFENQNETISLVWSDI